MTDSENWTGISEDAQLYETNYVPTLFGPWAPRVADAARISSGDRVLDVGCGTGVLAREAIMRVGPAGQVSGLDQDAGMLAVARRINSDIEWHKGNAIDLPFNDEQFDVVVSQFALMYFPDQVVALKEMRRVLVPDGRLAVAVWGPYERATGYVTLAELARRYAGEAAVDIIKAPHKLGNRDQLKELFTESGFKNAVVSLREGVYTQPSIEYFIESEVKGSPLNELFNKENYPKFLDEARLGLESYLTDNGELVIPMDAFIVTATKTE